MNPGGAIAALRQQVDELLNEVYLVHALQVAQILARHRRQPTNTSVPALSAAHMNGSRVRFTRE